MAEKTPATSTPAAAKPAAQATPEEMADAEKLLAGASGGAASGTEAGAAGHGAHPAAAPGGKKGAKQSSSLKKRIDQGGKWLRAQLVELFRSLRSPDGPTRRMAFFFFLSLGALIGLGIVTVERKVRLKHEREAEALAAREDAELRAHEAELLVKSGEAPSEHAEPVRMFSLGQFTIELKPLEGQPAKGGGFTNMAEVEIVVDCDSPETRTYIEDNLVAARGQVTDVFVSMDREELLSREGKRRLKKKIIERLNGWVPRGKVQAVFFSKLVVA
jgi:flagellar basal body-associated protein FliL